MAEEKSTLDDKLLAELVINDADIYGELAQHSVKQHYWGSMWARAVRQRRTAELDLEALEATLSKTFREQMAESEPATRITEKMIKEYVTGHPSYTDESKKVIHLEYLANIFGVAKNAFESRGRMLIELSKQTAEGKFYEREYTNMKNEFERREEETSKRRRKVKPTVPETAVIL